MLWESCVQPLCHSTVFLTATAIVLLQCYHPPALLGARQCLLWWGGLFTANNNGVLERPFPVEPWAQANVGTSSMRDPRTERCLRREAEPTILGYWFFPKRQKYIWKDNKKTWKDNKKKWKDLSCLPYIWKDNEKTQKDLCLPFIRKDINIYEKTIKKDMKEKTVCFCCLFVSVHIYIFVSFRKESEPRYSAHCVNRQNQKDIQYNKNKMTTFLSRVPLHYGFCVCRSCTQQTWRARWRPTSTVSWRRCGQSLNPRTCKKWSKRLTPRRKRVSLLLCHPQSVN